MQIIGWLDVPADGATVARGAFFLGGWVFKSTDGQRPAAPFVAFEEIGGAGRHIPCSRVTLDTNVYRPDVLQMFGAGCPGLTAYSAGYNIGVEPPPVGTWKIWMSWADDVTGAQWSASPIVTVTP